MGTPLVEIGDTAGLEAAIEFLSQDAVKIGEGQRAEIYNWGGPADIPAEVRRVEPQGFTKVSALGVEEQRTLVILQFTASPTAWAGLAPGYRVWGRVYLRQLESAILAPLGALIRDRGDVDGYVTMGPEYAGSRDCPESTRSRLRLCPRRGAIGRSSARGSSSDARFFVRRRKFPHRSRHQLADLSPWLADAWCEEVSLIGLAAR